MKKNSAAVVFALITTISLKMEAASVIGFDDFDGSASYLSRDNSSAVNTAGATWDVVNRANVLSEVILDTSKYLRDGSAGDGVDLIGFLESAKTDNFFGIYRGGLSLGVRTLRYTFNISGASGLSLAMDWASTGDVVNQGIAVTASIDGGPEETVFEILYDGADSTTTMEDGRIIPAARSGYAWINGAKTTMLTDEFATYIANIAAGGDVLTLTLIMTGTSAGSAYGMDNLVLRSGPGADSTASAGIHFALVSTPSAVTNNPNFYRHVSYGDDPAQIMNFWKAESDHPTPVVFSIHGGGWHGGAMEEELNGPYYNRGVSYCSIEYRLISNPEILLPVPVMDAARALQFLRSKADEWNIDKNRIVLTGGSAGACTGMWLAFHDDLADPASSDPVARESTRVQGAFLINGQTTLDPFQIEEWIGMSCVNHMMIWNSVGASSAEDLMSNWDKYKELSLKFSPVRFLDAGDPPVYIKYGLSAELPPADSSHAIHHPMFGIKLKEMADAIGYPCYIEVPGLQNPAVSSREFLDKLLLAPVH